MTSNVKLLPLPEKVEVDKHLPTGVRIYAYDKNTLKDYARANVEHHTTALENKYDDLWAVKETYREKVEVLEQVLDGTNTLCQKATAAQAAEIARLKEELDFQSALTKNLLPYQDEAVASRASIEALRAEVRTLVRQNGEWQARAERLAEALWLAMDWNWLDEDARPSRTAEICDAALDPTAAQEDGRTDLIELAKQQAAEIACAGHNGWGNTMLELAAALEAASA